MKPIILIAALALAGCVNQTAWDFGAGYVPGENDDTGPSMGARPNSTTNVREFSAAGMNLRSYDKGGLSYIEHRGSVSSR